MSPVRRASYNSQCPVTRDQHEWVDFSEMGGEAKFWCQKCHADSITIDEEWRLYWEGFNEFIQFDNGDWKKR